MNTHLKTFAFLLASVTCSACVSTPPPSSTSRWTQFVQVDGQPEPVPVEWVSTPEGKFAHSIKLPDPLPKDSGYREGMDSKEYFEHLCKTEAGEFIYKTVENVDGFYFARPPLRPTSDDLRDPYKLEAPEIERSFQFLDATPRARAGIFVDPPWSLFSFVEEPAEPSSSFKTPLVRSSGYRQGTSPMNVNAASESMSNFGVIWRGIRRPNDRALMIAGSEWIVYNLKTNEVLAVQRNFARTGFNRTSREGIYWASALQCPTLNHGNLPMRTYSFIVQSLRPIQGDKK